MTSQEAEYPSLLCKHTVDCVLDEIEDGPTLHDSAIALANFEKEVL